MRTKKGTVLFTCEECGLETPGLFELPELPDDYPNPVVLSHECGHCDAALERSFASAVELLASAEKGRAA